MFYSFLGSSLALIVHLVSSGPLQAFMHDHFAVHAGFFEKDGHKFIHNGYSPVSFTKLGVELDLMEF